MSRVFVSATLIAIALTVATSGTFWAATGTTVQSITVHGPSLVGNLEGDSPDRSVFVYLPPGYNEQRDRRYPVVYLLHGYGGGADIWNTRHRVAEDMDKAFAKGSREFIIVAPDARTIYDGSFYSSSVTVGDWEKYIAEDLVRYVDGHYRTIAARDSRGLAGFSMGGYGTFRLAMKRPDAFSAVYAMSSCCLAPTGGAGRQGTNAVSLEKVATLEDAKAVERPLRTTLALAAAWAPNPSRAPLFLDVPTKNGEPQLEVIAALNANAGITMLHQHIPALKSLKAIGMEIGLQDGLLASNERMHALLESYKIPHVWETYQGDHGSQLAERIETRMVPFFSKNLTFK